MTSIDDKGTLSMKRPVETTLGCEIIDWLFFDDLWGHATLDKSLSLLGQPLTTTTTNGRGTYC